MNAGTCWEQEYNRPNNGLGVEKAPKSDLTCVFLVSYSEGSASLTYILMFAGFAC